MKILIIALVISSYCAYSQNPNKTRVGKMRDLKVMVGTWDVSTRMMPSPDRIIPETGTMTCVSLYDSTYLECDVSLTNGKRKRAYKQLLTYEPDSSRYSQIYLYSDSPMKIMETGHFRDGVLETLTRFRNYKGEMETITAIMKVTDNNNLYYESRSTAVNNAVDYIAEYRRRR